MSFGEHYQINQLGEAHSGTTVTEKVIAEKQPTSPKKPMVVRWHWRGGAYKKHKNIQTRQSTKDGERS